ncbi:hypothetical protein F2Q70_00018853 [Brassica cretica]|uniref:Uncharacterized protein n=1 Tax=Brassica cretica TaxID=69181 RepID=A0A8S9KP98_BRACR|nr:hypothetical protein F2Q70_00018853 [Brassica cretica]KAF2596724.1 hypothetical protein F2Q68_00012474 [Brassica cretica]
MGRLVIDQNDLVTLVCEFEFQNGVKLIGGFYWGCAVCDEQRRSDDGETRRRRWAVTTKRSRAGKVIDEGAAPTEDGAVNDKWINP